MIMISFKKNETLSTGIMRNGSRVEKERERESGGEGDQTATAGPYSLLLRLRQIRSETGTRQLACAIQRNPPTPRQDDQGTSH